MCSFSVVRPSEESVSILCREPVAYWFVIAGVLWLTSCFGWLSWIMFCESNNATTVIFIFAVDSLAHNHDEWLITTAAEQINYPVQRVANRKES